MSTEITTDNVITLLQQIRDRLDWQNRQVFDARQAAEYLGICRTKFDALVAEHGDRPDRAGLLKVFRHGGIIRYRRVWLDEFMELLARQAKHEAPYAACADPDQLLEEFRASRKRAV